AGAAGEDDDPRESPMQAGGNRRLPLCACIAFALTAPLTLAADPRVPLVLNSIGRDIDVADSARRAGVSRLAPVSVDTDALRAVSLVGRGAVDLKLFENLPAI